MEKKVSEIKIDIRTRKEACSICLNDDINANQMFTVDKCDHKFCFNCVKQHIEVSLIEGSVLRCLDYGCTSLLNYRSCFNFLTPKQRIMWGQRIKENLIPVTDRVYCPNPRCSALMSETELSKSTKEVGVTNRRCCGKCGEPFCLNCKVSWHNDLSCDHYKKLHPNPTTNDRKLKRLAKRKMWRQCRKCQHMIELSQGCVSVVCKCGHTFCYVCGADDGACRHGHQFPLPPWCLWLTCCFVLLLVIIAVIVLIYFFVIR